MVVDKTVVLVTGSNSGIGLETVHALAAASSDYHILLCSRSVEKGNKALAEVQARNPKNTVSILQLDVTDADSISAAVKTVESDYGHVDVIINNAGIVSFAPTLIQQLRDTFEANTFGPAVVTEAFLPLLKKSTVGARLIYVSSSLGSLDLRADPKDPYHAIPADVYRMSKAALDMHAICQHVQLEKEGIKVFAMCPGYVVSNLTGEAGREQRVKQGALGADTSAQTLLAMIEGKRDADAGKFVHKDGVYPW